MIYWSYVLIGQTKFINLFLNPFNQSEFSFLIQKQVSFRVLFTTIFQIMTASFLAVALMADTRPFLKLIL